jgi:hypothetical protein
VSAEHPTKDGKYYTDTEIAGLLGISLGRLRNKLCAGSPLPPRIQPPGCRNRLWLCQAVHDWLEQFTVAVARDVMMASSFDEERRRQNNRDYELAEVVSIFLNGPKGIHAATIMCQNLNKAISENRAYAFDCPRLLNNLAEVQPTVFLDVFLEGDDVEDYQRRRMFIDDIERHDNPLSKISDDELLSWCERDPSSRYPLVASAMKAFKKSDETGKYEWKPFVYTIFDKAPALDDVLEQLADALRPMSWSGSRADILQKRAVLYQNLYEHDNEEVVAWARSRYTKLQEEIRNEREREDQQDRGRNESFE